MKIILSFLLLLPTLVCFSQKDEESVDITDYTVNHISLDSPIHKFKTPIPVLKVSVFDIRFDSSALGCYKNSFNGKLVLIKSRKTFCDEASNFYSSLITSVDSVIPAITIHCYIKKLFLSDHIDITETVSEKNKSPKKNAELKSGIVFQTEFYIQQEDKLIPFYRFDTTITGQKKINRSGGEYLYEAFAESLRKSQTINWRKTLEQGKKLTQDEVTAYNNQRNNFPLHTNGFSKGIYLSFEDFRNNKPATTEFTVEKGATGDFLYIKNQKGEDALLTDLWGYSNGKEAFIFSANNYFKLHRSGNSFIIYGAKDFSGRRSLRLNAGLFDAISPNSNFSKAKTAKSYHLIKNYFQLDMETGNLY